jgi:hypothetical protein
LTENKEHFPKVNINEMGPPAPAGEEKIGEFWL